MNTMINVEAGFQRSVNIGYDIYNAAKLKSFIPTKAALDLLEEILLSVIPNSSERARILIGAYGKGKSHIILAILSILMRQDLNGSPNFAAAISKNPKLSQLVQFYYDSNQKILPVVISGSHSSLSQAFLISLQRTLSENNLIDVMPETNYRAALKTIKRWRKSFPVTFQDFKDKLNEPVEIFIDRLKSFEVAAYELFEKIYPALTAGGSFNPFVSFEVPEIYESVAKSLKAKGYSGIFVVYDEFSKFLETNILSASINDTKTLQDLAEKCARSGKLQLHLLLISHKEISNYIDKLPKEKTDGWRGVSERFKHVRLNNNFSQTYEIISAVIQHDQTSWLKFIKRNSKNFVTLFNRYKNHPMFKDSAANIQKIIFGCFPLHPVSTFILPRLSEKIAQNERTLFTFMSADGNSTLRDFLSDYKNDFTLLTPDKIFDYFEPLFQNELQGGELHQTFILTRKILDQLDVDTLASKIVKTVSLIYILAQFECLAPTKTQIMEIFSASYKLADIERAIQDLIERDFFIYIKRSNNFLRLKQTSGVDIRQKINALVEKQRGRVAPKDILNAANFDNFIYPSRYNDCFAMTRFFAFKFISGSEVSKSTDWEIKIENVDADGVIYGVIPESVAQIQTLQKILLKSKKVCERVLFVLPKEFIDVEKIILEYSAVETLRDSAVEDSALFDDYEIIFEDLQEIIKSFICSYTRPENLAAIYIHNQQILKLQRKAELTEVLSQICASVYHLTPIINNEAVNKNDITTVAQNSRNKIVAALLRNETEKNLGFHGNGQEVSIMRSTLIRTGILIDSKEPAEINLRPSNSAMCNLLETIENFILGARQTPVSLAKLYEQLTAPKYHIGLRRGVIPIYLAAVFHHYRRQIIIKAGKTATPINADILFQINCAPQNFSLEFLDWNSEKENYIENLSCIFSDYIIETEKAANIFDGVANSLKRWYFALPKFSKESLTHPSGEKIAGAQLKMIGALKSEVGSAELLFKRLPAAFDAKENFEIVTQSILTAKNLFDGLIDELENFLISETKNFFTKKEILQSSTKISLTKLVGDWLTGLDAKIFEQVFSDGKERLLQLLRNSNDDEKLLIRNFAQVTTGLRLEDWNSLTIGRYFDAVKNFVISVENFTGDAVKNSKCCLTFTDSNGKLKKQNFETVGISPRGNLLFNQLTSALDAMGQSISLQEKRQVILEVLKNL